MNNSKITFVVGVVLIVAMFALDWRQLVFSELQQSRTLPIVWMPMLGDRIFYSTPDQQA